MITPDLTEKQLGELPSRAEAKVYRALRDQLSNDYVVLFQVGWILQKEKGQAQDGEIDFLICHRAFGYLCIEVKGGGIEFDADTGSWYSIDRNRTKHSIKNPISQALKAKYSIRSKLDEQQGWRDLSLGNVLRGHAVFFPDVGDTHLLSRPDMPSVLIGSADSLNDLVAWIESAFQYWGDQSSGYSPLGRRGVEVIRKIFGRSFTVTPLLSSRLADQEVRRLSLTKDQMRVLDFLRSHRRVAVSGGAGTGKTVLALEKARRLAAEGFRTLLTCYNRQLADHLARQCAGLENIDVMSFHQLCSRQVDKVKRQSNRDLIYEAKVTYPGKNLYDVHFPNALAYSLEVLEDRYEAIVCDEGQDFREEYWVPLELLLSDYDKSPFYVFYDDNQNIYARAGTFPIQDEPFNLTTNCRNTKQIHNLAYSHYKGVPVDPPDNDGDDVQFECVNGIEAQAKKINARIVDLIARESVSSGDIVVLIGDALHKIDYYERLKKLPLPKPVVWAEESHQHENSVLLDTIQRFKGLESAVVILWGLDGLDLKGSEELLYVGMSRAKSMLIVVAQPTVCEELESGVIGVIKKPTINQ
jgi:Nuclease-related domain/UvrD-like helicase C-terminal domain/AAA domain